MALSPDRFPEYMAQALALAEQGRGWTDPNPMVGALLVSPAGEILGQGFHPKAGEPHAEVFCLQAFEQVPPDATLFVTLEPCAHHGKTPPCLDLLIRKGVKNLVVAQADPNPLVAGKSLAKLREMGVQVTQGVLEKEARQLNRVFNYHIQARLPYVALKAAMSLDGKIALESGESQWISSEESRQAAHGLRAQFQGILVGKGTFLADNPRLDCRLPGNHRQPFPILVASQNLELNSSHLVADARQKYLLTTESFLAGSAWESAGFTLIRTPGPRVEFKQAFSKLYQAGVTSLLVEGGSEVMASLLAADLVQEIHLFIAPRVIGQQGAPAFVQGLQLSHLSETPWFCYDQIQTIGPDLWIRLFPKAACSQELSKK